MEEKHSGAQHKSMHRDRLIIRPSYVFAVALLIGGLVWYYTNARQAQSGVEVIEREIPTEIMQQQTHDTSPESPVPMTIDKSKRYVAVVNTSQGAITVELNVANTPVAVNNFVHLARQGFYNGTVFHRVMEGFMIQGGDPNGDGTGGPGYLFADEPFEGDYLRGVVAMANRGPDTNGSQFFIMHQDYDLPKNYVIFGKVIEGMDVVDAIATAPTTSNSTGTEMSRPVNPVAVDSVVIQEQ